MISRLASSFALVLAVLACALPWGLAPEFRLVLPLLPYVVIHRASEHGGDGVPDWLVFLAGFATDVAGQGPLGYWSLVYLCGYTIVRSATAGRELGLLPRMGLFLVTATSLGLMQWSVASIYYLRAVDIAPIVVSTVVAFIAYLMALLLVPVGRSLQLRTNERLERGQ